jgi:Flp pilus assembly protein TadD
MDTAAATKAAANAIPQRAQHLTRASNYKGAILLNLGHHEQALVASSKALDLIPDYPEVFQHKGMA